MSIEEEKRLIVLAGQMNMDALSEIYDSYSPGIYRYAMRLTGNTQSSEDCVSDVFSRFLQALGKKQGPKEYLRAYLYRIAHNWIIDYYRHEPHMVSISERFKMQMEENSPSAEAERLMKKNHIRKAILDLPEDQQRVVVLRYLDDWDFEEIASSMKKSSGAVKALLHRGLTNLRRTLLPDKEDI